MALLRAVLIISVTALAALGASADQPPLGVSAAVDRAQVAVGDTFRLDIDLDWKEGVEVKPLALGEGIGAFTIRDVRYGIASHREDRLNRRVSLLLTVFETGEQTVPSIQIVFIDENGTPMSAESPPVDIEVVSVLAEDAADIRDIKAPIAVPRRWKDLILSYLLLAGLIAGAATSVLLSVMRRDEIEIFLAKVWHKITAPLRRFLLWVLAAVGLVKREGQPIFDIRVTEPDLVPEDAALRELDRIEALGLIGRGMIKEHYTLVSETVRRYLERKYGVLAMESPTSYTLLALSDVEPAAGGMGLVREVLEEGDMVKFAKHVPAPESRDSVLERARTIVHLTGRAAAPVAGEG